MKVKYFTKKFSTASMAIIGHANTIISEYMKAGYTLTLRQLYYQFVSRDLLANLQKNYKRLGSILSDARYAGLVDWDGIEDRTRNLASLATWNQPGDIINACAKQFRIDLWANQAYRLEVWIEKEALAGVFERVCNEYRVPYLSCRGYNSTSEMRGAAERLKAYLRAGQNVKILHFGDHDPSGINMTRDMAQRLELLCGRPITIDRLALNMPQVEEYDPPPNPAKQTDSRYASYADEFGDESWELDALDPAILSNLVREAIEGLMLREEWAKDLAIEEEHKRLLGWVSRNWERIVQEERNGK